MHISHVLEKSPDEAFTQKLDPERVGHAAAGSARPAADDARQYLENGSGVLLLAGDMRRANILAEILRKEGVRAAASENPGRLPGPGQCRISSGGLSAGREYPSLRLAVLTDTQIMGAGLRRQKRRKKAVGEMIDS